MLKSKIQQEGTELVIKIPEEVIKDFNLKEGEDLNWEITPYGIFVQSTVPTPDNSANYK